jgi:hypothetical protein
MPTLPRVRVSDNHRFLVTEENQPFFWLGDTAWELFHRLSREEAAHFLDTRQKQRFTVIQAVALAEVDGLRASNFYGESPLVDNDVAKPNEKYFSFVDEVVEMGAARGLYIALLPTWGDKVCETMWGAGPVIFTPETARAYGRWIGARYRSQSNILWVLGGDRPAIHEDRDWRPVWREMAEGIDEGAGEGAFMTYHPYGGHSSSAWLHEEPWLDMNMMQSGHGSGHDTPVWEAIAADYARTPARPTLDGEPNYEDHPVNPWPKWDPATGYYRDHDVRKQLYRSVFAGGCGVTYGHHAVWQFYDPARREPINYPDRPWQEAIERPGAWQVQHLRALVESRPYLSRIPDQGMILSEVGQRGEHVQATRDSAGSYAFVYLPTPRPVTVETGVIRSAWLRAWWYDPRTAKSQLIGDYPTGGGRTFIPPSEGPDWVLGMDDASRQLALPGQG